MSYIPQMYTVAVTVTAAQIKNLNTTPILLVAGVSGCVLDVKSCFLRYNFNTTPFGTINANDCILVINSATPNDIPNCFGLGEGFGIATGFVDQSQSMGLWLQPAWSNQVSTDTPVAASSTVGTGLYLFQYDIGSGFPAGANWSTGDGTITAILRYSVIKVTA
jgi:hypothetical protein